MSLLRFRRAVVVAGEDESASAVADKMREAHVGCVVVVRGEHPIGILTDRDLAMRVVAEKRDSERTRVSDIITYDPFVLQESDTIDTATARMRDHGVRRMPIVDNAGKLTGIVTADELIVLLRHGINDLCLGMEEAADACDSR